MLALLASISGSDLIDFVVLIVVAGLIFWLLTWLVSYVEIKEPFNKIAKAVIAIFAVVIVIAALLRVTGVHLG